MNENVRILTSLPLVRDDYGGHEIVRCCYTGMPKERNEAARLGWLREEVLDLRTNTRYVRFRSNIGTV